MLDRREIYQQLILDHNRHPRNYRAIEGATGTAEGYNPLCGDRYSVYVTIDGDRIDDVAFRGAGCAISKASASLMTHLVRGKTLGETEKLFDEFRQIVTGKAGLCGEPGDLAAFAGVRDYPSRLKCATLAWHTLKAALEGRTETTTEQSIDHD